MEIRIFQKGFNYSQDGPGNRLVYHLYGCNMRCPWCANPEGLSADGPGTPVEELIDEVLRSCSLFFEGGGVTFTGGEPTLQFEALSFILKTLKRHGIDTAIETNASHVRLPELFGEIDHLLMDLKSPWEDRHRALTGISLEPVLGNLRRACAEHGDVLIHIPMVNGYNASRQDMEGFVEILKSLPQGHVRVEPLWYHEYGKSKWERLRLPYTVENGHLSEAQKQEFLNLLKAGGLNVVRT